MVFCVFVNHAGSINDLNRHGVTKVGGLLKNYLRVAAEKIKANGLRQMAIKSSEFKV